MYDGRYTPEPDILPSEIRAFLFTDARSAQATLELAFSRASCPENRAGIELRIALDRKSHRQHKVWHDPAHREGTVYLKDDCEESGWGVVWDNEFESRRDHEWAPKAPAPRFYFSLERDDSPYKSPFVYLEWVLQEQVVLLLFKKQHESSTEPPALTREEAARLGIGMSHGELEVAYALSLFKAEPVVFQNRYERSRKPVIRRPASDVKEA